MSDGFVILLSLASATAEVPNFAAIPLSESPDLTL